MPSSSSPSFSPRRKWSIAFNVMLTSIAVFLIVAGVNYLGHRQPFFKRFYLSSNSRIRLSPKTVSLLHSLTNTVEAIVYYDKNEPLYGDIIELLKEYEAQTPKLTVRTVDYYADPGASQEVKLKFKLGTVTNRDFVIFSYADRAKFVDGNSLSDYHYDFERTANPDDQRLRVNQQRVAFSGEEHFSAAIFALTQSKPLKAYFLQGHGEPSPNDNSEITGYGKLADIFHRNYVVTATLDGLLGTNAIPSDCNLLVIAGPKTEFKTNELDKISQYLDQGGRLFVLFDVYSTTLDTGLENVLAKWNVRVSHSVVRDPADAVDSKGQALGVSIFAVHDVTQPILGKTLEMVLPRPIERIKPPSAADDLQMTELAFSGTNSTLADTPAGNPRAYPLIAAVERNAAKGIATERGTTRILVTGDALFLNNQIIDYSVNQDFADSAVNWLLNRTELLAGVGARPVREYRLALVRTQVTQIKEIMLGAIPGGILLFGGVVWLRRRK